MLAWISFTVVPLVIGAIMMLPKMRHSERKRIGYFFLVGNAAIVVFLLVALYGFGDLYGRVVLYEFWTGSVISIAVIILVDRWNGS